MNTAGLGSNQTYAPQPNFELLTLQISSKLSKEIGITDKTLVITDRGGGRNEPSTQAGKKLCSVDSFPDSTLVSVRNLKTYTVRQNNKNNFVLNVLTHKCENSIWLNFQFANKTGLPHNSGLTAQAIY
jgi:hypothetical protein